MAARVLLEFLFRKKKVVGKLWHVLIVHVMGT